MSSFEGHSTSGSGSKGGSESTTFPTGPGDQSVTVDHGMDEQGNMTNVIRTEGTTLGKAGAPGPASSQGTVQKTPPTKAD